MDFDEEIVEEIKAMCISQQGSGIQQRIGEMILSKSDGMLIEVFDKRSRSSDAGQAITDYTRALFFVLGPRAKHGECLRSAKLLLRVVLKILTLIHSGKLSVDRKVMDCLAFLLQELDALPQNRLPSIAEQIVAHLESANQSDELHTLQLLPRCLSLITASVEEVEVPGIDGEEELLSSGIEYRNSIARRILAVPWSKTLLIELTGLLREMPLDPSQVVEFANKIFRQMKHAEPQDLPALVYQLLLLASKGFRRMILKGILSAFGELFYSDSDTGKEGRKLGKECKRFAAEVGRQIEATVILHINFAVKQDLALGQEILYLVRARCLSLTPFVASVLLSIARIQRFEEPAMRQLKRAAVKSYDDFSHCRKSKLALPVLKYQGLQAIKAVEQSLMQTARNTAFGWDHIIPSLVRLGFTLIEVGHTGEIPPEDDSSKADSVHDSKELGVLILRTAFEVHEMARDEIIEQCKCRIIGLKPEQSSLIIRMLSQLVKNYPHLMLEHVSRLKECLDYFTFLHPISGSSLVHTIGPLLQLSSDLQSYTVLVLRKAMFGREATARMTAVQGIFNLMIGEKQAKNTTDSDSLLHSSSEASCSQYERTGFRKNLSLLLEMKGLLRRCLLQQASIRETLYRGLVKLVLVDPDTAETAFNLVWPQFCRYLEVHEDTQVTLKLNSCIRVHDDVVNLEEPLDHLLSCVHNLLALQPQGSNGRQSAVTETCFGFSLSQDHELGRISSGESLSAAFTNFRRGMQKCTLGDFNLDKTQNFTLETMEGKINVEKGCLLLGVLEVLIDMAVSQMVQAENDTKLTEAKIELKSYISLHDSIEQIMSQKQGNIFKGLKMRTLESTNSFGHIGKQTSSLQLQATEKQIPFLKPSNIAHMLHIVLNANSQTPPPNSQPSSQDKNQRLLQMEICVLYPKIASLALRSCLRHLQAVACEPVDLGENMNSFRDLVCGDWKILGDPILKVLFTATSSSRGVFSATSEKLKDKEKNEKGRKSAADESREGLLLTAVKCLDELCKLAQKKNCFVELLGHMCPDLVSESASICREAMANGSMNEVPDMESESELSSESKLIQMWLVNKIRPLLEELLQRSRFREFEILAGTMICLGKRLALSHVKLHSAWAEQISRSLKITYTAAARSLTMLSVCLNPPPNDLITAQALSQELLKVMGSDEIDAIEVSGVYPIINTSSRNGIAGFLLQHAEATLIDIEWVISKLKLQPLPKVPCFTPEFQSLSQGESSRMKLEVALHSRMEALILVLSNFVKMSLTGAPSEHFLRVSVRLYKCLAAATKLCIAPRGYKQPLPSNRFQTLVEVACKRLTTPLYSFMAVMQRDQQENTHLKGSVNKIKREGRMIPNLIFHVEDYERYLIQLSTLTKVNLMRHAKRSTARDFKIIDFGKKCKQSNNNEQEQASSVHREEPNSEEENSEPEQESAGGSQGSGKADGDEEHVNEENEEECRPRFQRPHKQKGKRVVQDSEEDESDQEGETKKRRRPSLCINSM